MQQVISCDICGAQKRQANHWFLVREECGELHIGGWNPRQLFLPGIRHLCGETCLHKLISQDLMKVGSSAMQRVDEGGQAEETRTRARSIGPVPSPSTWQTPRIASASGEYIHPERAHPRSAARTS